MKENADFEKAKTLTVSSGVSYETPAISLITLKQDVVTASVIDEESSSGDGGVGEEYPENWNK